jgi:hypothetical protein
VTDDELRRLAAAVRAIPLENVLTHWGADRDRLDRARWNTHVGTLSITGSKFFNWQRQQGGGGAIDLVMHLGGGNWRQAVRWLAPQLAAQSVPTRDQHKDAATSRPVRPVLAAPQQGLRLPAASAAQLPRVRRYLIDQRQLAAHLIDTLIQQGTVYADQRANAVFRMLAGKPNRTIGAELRGTGPTRWRGLAPGSRRDTGYFWIGQGGSRTIVLCESAIDAISCIQLDPTRICLSTAGVRHNPPWLSPLLHGYDVHCGFDNDEAGHAAAETMIMLHPSIKRLVPPAHDWNDVLISQ